VGGAAAKTGSPSVRFPGSIRSPRVVEFLSHLLRHIPGKLLVVWDGLRGHRGRLVWDFVPEQRGRIWLGFLPAYAPELNPVEYLWSHWKHHKLPNFCPKTFGELSHYGGDATARDDLVIMFVSLRQADILPPGKPEKEWERPLRRKLSVTLSAITLVVTRGDLWENREGFLVLGRSVGGQRFSDSALFSVYRF